MKLLEKSMLRKKGVMCVLWQKLKTWQGCTGGSTAAAEVIVAAALRTGALTASAPLAGDGECPGSSHSSTQKVLLTPGA